MKESHTPSSAERERKGEREGRGRETERGGERLRHSLIDGQTKTRERLLHLRIIPFEMSECDLRKLQIVKLHLR